MKVPTVETELANLSTALRGLRKGKGLTLKQVSNDTGISVSFICDVEKGRTNPSLDTIHKLAKRYHTWVKVIF